MRSKWITVLAGLIATVVLVSVVIGLTSPDGSVTDGDTAKPSATATTATTPSPTPTATTPSPPAKPARPTAARAPASVRGPWPGRPDSVTLDGDRVDWCPAVRTTGATEAVEVFGKAAVDDAACAAVRFIFGKRYSRLAIPRDSYDAQDLDFVLPALASSTTAAFRPRVDAFVADPDSLDVREELGLVVLRGDGTLAGATRTSAGSGRVFYGTAYSADGYRDRAVWINPRWSKVAISVDRSKAEPRIVAVLDAAAAVPVFNPAERRDDMLTVPTHAMFFLRKEGSSWKVGGWRITSGTYDYARLTLR
ncbi:hypothetical protein [Aeromicrobium ginsengisoli]|uniref:Uncharacterized protein n=1 Tax=Aeromicrobium ginsengisoli TaxID=363867 RepID=A0A5M4FB01_9ACTN|nr:hypothetical protein [Aeromicrobium ginsengisoli]KAA1394401.1 hypothetical protein ESP70_019600 [Aeromicrobium ginsengisoli]